MSRETAFSIALLVLLLIPYCIRAIAPALEPYPAILLPAGTTKLKISQHEFSVRRQIVYGQRPTSLRWIPIDKVKFIEPILVQFFEKISGNHFGLRESPREIRVNRVGVFNILRTWITDKERADTKEWFQNKLRQLGFESTGFKIVTETLTVDSRTGNIVRTEVINEEFYRLD